MDQDISGVYLITDYSISQKHGRTINQDAILAIECHIPVIQYREKKKPQEIQRVEAISLGRLIAQSKSLYIINDNLELALDPEVQADGVHIGQSDLNGSSLMDIRERLGDKKILGVSVHTPKQALEAINAGADYLGVGTVYGTKTKTDGTFIGLDGFIKVVQAVRKSYPSSYIPIVAIGGINESNIEEIIRAGADSTAMISAILDHDNITERIRIFQEKFRS